ncbi:MAG: acetyl esterase [Solirubrobacteraceae bacterium]|jgi:acetyl esterase|nr:acetyl esterase [Solirubrobacteraceae bacterium]
MAGLHPQVEALARAATLEEADDPAELAAMRADYAQAAVRLGGALEPVDRVEDVIIARPADEAGGAGLRARAYWPKTPAQPLGAVVWLHGGGWCVGDLEGFDRVCRSLCNSSGAVVISVDYRLAPEHPFPAAVVDADLAVAWAAGHGAAQLGYDASRVVVGGDSAGGNLATIAARHNPRAVRAQLLVYPAVDAAMDSPSYREFGDFPLLTADAMDWCWRTYLGGSNIAASDPDVSPLAAGDLAGAPPAFIAVAGHDVLRDEGIAYAEALEAAGVPVTLRRYEDMTHGFLRWGGVVDRTRELVAELGEQARTALRG